MTVDLTLLSAVLGPIIGFIGVFWMIFTTRKLNRKLSEYEPLIESIGDLLRYEEDESGAPQIDVRLSKMIQVATSGIAKSIQMSLLGQQSGVARLDKGLKTAITADIVNNKLPILGLLDDVLGLNTKKYIAKNPEAVSQLAGWAAPMIQKFTQKRNNGQGQGGIQEMR